MNRFAKFSRSLRGAVTLLATFLALATGCTAVDDMLGEGMQPGDQQMQIGIKLFTLSEEADRPYFETRLYRTDSIRSSKLGKAFFGSMYNERFGRRTAGFLSQYCAAALSDTSGFGFRPIFDSIQIRFTVSEYAGDTLQPVRYNVYEVISNDYLDSSTNPVGAGNVADTVYYPFFDPMPYVRPEPVFTFTFPNATTVVDATYAQYVTMQPTEAGEALIRRLMLLDGKYKDNMELYRNADLWQEEFKGVYIAPAKVPAGEGNLFAATLSEAGLYMYMRNRNELDPTLIQDTLTASYAFYREGDPWGGVSINTIRHDYTGSAIDPAAIEENNPDRPLSPTLYVEGMDGVVGEVTFTDALLEAIEGLYDEVTDPSGIPYQTIAVNQAYLSFYLEGSDYNWEKIDAATITPLLDRSAGRLGLYTDYKTLTPVEDYYFTYEQTISDYILPYDGYLNRSRAAYTMDITTHVQSLWKQYLEYRAGKREEVELRTIFVGPEAYGLYTMPYTVLQGMEQAGAAPLRLSLTYTMIK